MSEYYKSSVPVRGNQGKFCIGGKYYKADEYGYEAAAEYLTSEVLRYSNLSDYVSYSIVPNLYHHQGVSKHCCESDDFMEHFPDGREVTVASFLQRICPESDLNDLINPDSKFRARHPLQETVSRLVGLVVTGTGLSDFGGYLTAVLELDALTRNNDRHYNNLSFIQFSNGLWKIAPVYDNGSAFGARDKDLAAGSVFGSQGPWLFNEARYYRISAMPFTSDFEKQVKACRSLYGSRLQIRQDIDPAPALSHIASIYGERVADRMESVWKISKNKYQDLFVPKITSPAYSSEQHLDLML